MTLPLSLPIIKRSAVSISLFLGWAKIAEAHIAAYKKYADAEIVAACDIIPVKAEEFCKKRGLEGVKCY